MDRDVEVEDFQRYSEKVDTSLYECPIESSPLFLLHKKGRNSSKPKTNQNKKLSIKSEDVINDISKDAESVNSASENNDESKNESQEDSTKEAEEFALKIKNVVNEQDIYSFSELIYYPIDILVDLGC